MKKRILLFWGLCLLAQWGMAQAPKWMEKAKRSVFSVITYDQDDKILNTGNGFFVTEDGIALSDYSLFKDAKRAVIVNSEGEQMPVEAIMGADDMYDVVKFKVAITGKKVPALQVVAASPAVGADAYLLPYSTRKDRSYTAGKVKAVDKVADNNDYYTLDMHLTDKMVSCPLVTADGLAFGMVQKSSGQDTATICYAVDVRFAMAQSISALSYNDMSLRNIGIKKALPDTEEQALVFLLMASSQISADRYATLLDDFVAQFPNSSEGYIRRASNRLAMNVEEPSMKLVSEDLDKALEVSQKKDDAYYNRAKLIYAYMLGDPKTVYKDWSFDKALEEIRKAIEMDPLPIYLQMEGDICYAKQDYASALSSYEKVNQTNLASPSTFFNAAKTKEMMKAPAEEVLALMDSCIARCPQPYTEVAAPYLLERAQARMNADQARGALQDYDAYYQVANGKVNDLFYYYREQAALKAKQYQRALDDMAKAIELNPKDLTYRAELAVVNMRVGRNEEALNVLNKALEIDPGYAEGYRLVGIAYLQLKKKDEACKNFRKAKELGDPNVDALIEKYCK